MVIECIGLFEHALPPSRRERFPSARAASTSVTRSLASTRIKSKWRTAGAEDVPLHFADEGLIHLPVEFEIDDTDPAENDRPRAAPARHGDGNGCGLMSVDIPRHDDRIDASRRHVPPSRIGWPFLNDELGFFVHDSSQTQLTKSPCRDSNSQPATRPLSLKEKSLADAWGGDNGTDKTEHSAQSSLFDIVHRDLGNSGYPVAVQVKEMGYANILRPENLPPTI